MSVGAVEQQGARMRADACRNRARIAAAAREAFVEHGADVPLDEIARRAGIGNATLYRHFPDRRGLIRTVTLSVLVRTAEQAEAARDEEPSAFAALRRFVHAAADERIGAVCPLLSGWVDPRDPEFAAARTRLERAVSDIIDAGRRSGDLRPDIAAGDVIVAVTQLARPLPGTGCGGADRFVHRHLDLLLDGLGTPRPTELSGSATTLEDLRRLQGEYR
ncbi:TetR/AcrR family transcriptional regulator [Streptacidiphilus sp. ASG 303]|uniref:TetR/AcrR family transcriptional regulator n=1 Tax=Streptacidiphilus sp. ASG 303 TaxID=2896847 RepID=UPI001E430CB1|nr:TetR/AcrR family transcriptional regulator [Streptacidiphilus sp. ASG 303]MCD0483838.1 TetR/AcrR family transcriptional regulator [Streptacidiphilus sp. ASG 303]